MKQQQAILLSMVMLAMVLIGAQTHALLVPASNGTRASGDGLKASVLETLEYINDRRSHGLPPVPGMRDVPDISIH